MEKIEGSVWGIKPWIRQLNQYQSNVEDPAKEIVLSQWHRYALPLPHPKPPEHHD